MLQCYFDDSGTHDNAKVVAWGGLVGNVDAFEKLDTAWRRALSLSIEGKPPLEKFSLSHCANAWDEFADYKPAERDLVRRTFRNLIIEHDVAPIAFTVSVRDWNAASTPVDRMLLGDAQNLAFFGCLDATGKIAGATGDSVSCHFDQGQAGIPLNSVLAAYQFMHPEHRDRISISFSSVIALTGLQAADTIAYEAYQYGLHLEDPKTHPLNPHFTDLVNRKGAIFLSLHRKEIDEFLIQWRKIMRFLLG
ncbi:MAG TPA: hypothetical protein VI732_06495 [Alphaproteobacteria bacterium]|nr:hypothetical protein [Alphaproteobacteria bacterium]